VDRVDARNREPQQACDSPAGEDLGFRFGYHGRHPRGRIGDITNSNSGWPVIMTLIITEFWGKARPVTDSAPAVHPLVAHCLDVAAVATLLPPRRGMALDPRVVGFPISLHACHQLPRIRLVRIHPHLGAVCPRGYYGPTDGYMATSVPRPPRAEKAGTQRGS